MSEIVQPFAEACAAIVEILGVSAIAIFCFYAVFYGLYRLIKKKNVVETYREVRRRLGRGILVGLEFLVAADIIHTVAVDLTWHSVGVLAIIVIIRTFLSFTLEVEITGRWPWESENS